MKTNIARYQAVLEGAPGDIVCADAIETLNALPGGTADLVVTSPPYFNAREEYASWPTYDAYLEWLQRAWHACYRLLKPGGRIAINIGAGYNRRPWLPLAADVTKQLQEAGFLLSGEIIWDKGQQASGRTAWGSWCSPSSPALRERHEVILVACRESFSLVDKGTATITPSQFLFFTQSIWHLNPETRRDHPAPFPVELPARLIRLLTWANALVVDPFMGSGTTAVAALRTGRRYFGCDLEPAYVAKALARVDRERLRLSQLRLPGSGAEPHRAVRAATKAARYDRLVLWAMQLREVMGQCDPSALELKEPEAILARACALLRERGGEGRGSRVWNCGFADAYAVECGVGDKA